MSCAGQSVQFLAKLRFGEDPAVSLDDLALAVEQNGRRRALDAIDRQRSGVDGIRGGIADLQLRQERAGVLTAAEGLDEILEGAAEVTSPLTERLATCTRIGLDWV